MVTDFLQNSFIYDYFVKPIISPEVQGYNLVNTGIYIILLVIACAIIYLALRKKIEFNHKFFISIIPYILFGISMRVIMHQIEAGLLVISWLHKTASPAEIGFWFFTPGIWLLTFALVVIGLLISGVHKKHSIGINTKRLFWFGVIVCAPALLFNISKFNNTLVFIGTALLITAVTLGVSYLINRFTKYKILKNPLNVFIIAGQAIDGIASSIAITFFNFSEQHVVSNAVLNIHPGLFVAIKIVIATLICWSLDDYLKEYSEKNKDDPKKIQKRINLIGFIKVVITILGFATGLASLFKLGII
ncbi:MAG: DUF63 family protein [Candidatus Diapherotrites archaeon]|nr:DUF63 family protein [Candidatus Diapherotrites archaeon]